LGKWTEHDSASAAGWAKKLPAGAIRDQALQIVISAVAEKDPEAAMALAQSSGFPAGNFQNVASLIFGSWAKVDPKIAAARATHLPPGSFRSEALESVASG